MKALCFVGILWVATAYASAAQTRVFDLVATSIRNKGGEFSEWTEAAPGVAVTIDERNHIKIYNQLNSSYRLLMTTDSGVDEEGDEYVVYKAVDEEGIECTVKILVDDEYYHIYAFYEDIALVFLIK